MVWLYQGDCFIVSTISSLHPTQPGKQTSPVPPPSSALPHRLDFLGKVALSLEPSVQ